MSRTRKGSKHPGYEFWSKRPGDGYGPIGKLITHRRERMQKKELVLKEVRDSKE